MCSAGASPGGLPPNVCILRGIPIPKRGAPNYYKPRCLVNYRSTDPAKMLKICINNNIHTCCVAQRVVNVSCMHAGIELGAKQSSHALATHPCPPPPPSCIATTAAATLGSFGVAFTYMTLEMAVYKTIGLRGAMSPLIIAGMGRVREVWIVWDGNIPHDWAVRRAVTARAQDNLSVGRSVDVGRCKCGADTGGVGRVGVRTAGYKTMGCGA
eukprot:347484-Chlamydomonas_euryale.AAC.2